MMFRCKIAPYSIILPFLCIHLTFQHHKANISLFFCISTHERTINISSTFCVGIWESTQRLCKRARRYMVCMYIYEVRPLLLDSVSCYQADDAMTA